MRTYSTFTQLSCQTPLNRLILLKNEMERIFNAKCITKVYRYPRPYDSTPHVCDGFVLVG